MGQRPRGLLARAWSTASQIQRGKVSRVLASTERILWCTSSVASPFSMTLCPPTSRATALSLSFQRCDLPKGDTSRSLAGRLALLALHAAEIAQADGKIGQGRLLGERLPDKGRQQLPAVRAVAGVLHAPLEEQDPAPAAVLGPLGRGPQDLRQVLGKARLSAAALHGAAPGARAASRSRLNLAVFCTVLRVRYAQEYSTSVLACQ